MFQLALTVVKQEISLPFEFEAQWLCAVAKNQNSHVRYDGNLNVCDVCKANSDCMPIIGNISGTAGC